MSFDVQSRYELLCRASQATMSSNHRAFDVAEQLDALGHYLRHDLAALARRGSPDHFADLSRNLEQELTRFTEFCEFPDLAQKVVVGVGGKFSCGKSSLINTILGKKRLVSEVDPTTSLPTYLLHGAQDEITALNLFGRRVTLSQDEFLSLTHDEKANYGSQVGTLLRSAFISDPEFAWQNLALLDTPGYTKPENQAHHARTDEQVARAQLNSAQFVVWLISAEDGTIKEDDLLFLASLRQDIPRLVLVNKADKKSPEDIAEIVALTQKTLADRNLAALAVIPVSRQKKHYAIEPVLAWLAQWNAVARDLTFAKNFKRQFTEYARFIEAEQRTAHLRLNRLNRISVVNDDEGLQEDAEELQHAAQMDLKRFEQLAADLHALRHAFFKTLKTVGDIVGIALPEPDELDLIDIEGVDLLNLLQELRESEGRAAPDYRRCWRDLMETDTAKAMPILLRRRAREYVPILAQLNQTTDPLPLFHQLK